MASKGKLTFVQGQIVKQVLKLMKSSKEGLPKLLTLTVNGITHAKLRHHFGSLGHLHDILKERYPEEVAKCLEAEDKDKTAKRILESVKNIISAMGRFPTTPELEARGVTYEAVRNSFGNLTGLFKVIRENHGHVFDDLFTSKDFTEERFQWTIDSIKESNCFAVSTIVSGCHVHEGAYQALNTWSEVANGRVIFQPMADPARPRQGQEMFFDPSLKDEHIAFRDIALNSKVNILSILYSAKRINPHDTAKRFADNQSLSLIASPKQRLTPLANMSEQPGYLFSPGAITISDYTTEMYMSNGTAYLADKMHCMGAGIVHIIGENRYRFSNVEFDIDGSFALDGKLYLPDGTVGDASIDYMFLADLHCAEIDKEAFSTLLESVSFFKPSEVFIQDAFSGVSINPFDTRSAVKQYHNKKVIKSLEAEIEDFHTKVSRIYALMSGDTPVINVVNSNHHLFLEIHIDSGAYHKNVTDFELVHKLALIRAADPEAMLIQKAYELVIPPERRIPGLVFLGPCQSVTRHGVECNAHGHKGAQGKKSPNIQKMREEYGPVNCGHGHVSEIYNGAFRVGTMEHLFDKRPAYARAGADMWSQSYLIGYSNGKRQLNHIINGN